MFGKFVKYKLTETKAEKETKQNAMQNAKYSANTSIPSHTFPFQ